MSQQLKNKELKVNRDVNTDADLVRLFQLKKQKNAFEKLYLRYKDMVFHYIKNFLYQMPEDMAQELVDEIFIKAYLEMEHLKNPEAFRVWLFRLSRNLCINYIKSNKFPYLSIDHNKNAFYISSLADERVNIENGFIAQEQKEAVFLELNALDKEIKEIIMFRYINKFTLEETSKVLHIPVRTIQDKIQKAFLRINQNLKDRGYIE